MNYQQWLQGYMHVLITLWSWTDLYEVGQISERKKLSVQVGKWKCNVPDRESPLWTHPIFGFVVTISSGTCSSSQQEILPSSSRRLTFLTTFFRSSSTANAWGSIVFMTQLQDVRNFSEHLETSNADISKGYK